MAIDHTAFKIPKVSQDFSQVYGLFTFDISDELFHVHEKVNGVVTSHAKSADALYAKSENGELVCQAGPNNGDITVVHTRRHARLHPNRGLIVSPSAFVDSYNITGAEVEYGVFNLDPVTLTIVDGITVAYIENKIFARVYSLGTITYNVQIDPAEISRLDGRGNGFNPAEGHLLDIQGQWRGVGNWLWWLSSPEDGESHVAHTFKALNALNNLSVSNPAMHAGFIARNSGGRGQVRAGCIEVSSEGGQNEGQVPFEIGNNTSLTADANGTVLLAARVPEIYKTRLNTRDIQLYTIIGSSVAKGRINVYQYPYDTTRLTKGAGLPLVDGDWSLSPEGSCLEYIDNSTGLITGFNDAGLRRIASFPIPANGAFVFNFPAPELAPYWIIHDDYIVIEGYTNNADMDAFLYYGELV